MSEERIDQRELRPHEGVGNTIFGSRFWIGNDCPARDFGPSSGTRWNGNESNLGLRVGRALVKEFLEGAVELRTESSGFRRVDD